MKTRIKELLGRRFRTIHRFATIVICIALTVYFMPRERVFNYHFSTNTPWSYGQLMANFDFPIYKSAEQMKAEQDSIRIHFVPYFAKDTSVAEKALSGLRNRYYGNFQDVIPYESYLTFRNRLKQLYERGIISSNELEKAAPNGATKARLITNNISAFTETSRFVKVPEAYRIIMQGDTTPHEIINRFRIEEFILPDIKYDSATSAGSLQQELEALSIANGTVQKGQKIISRGEIVDEKIYQILQSYHYELEKRHDENDKTTIMLIGQIILVSLCFISLFAYINIYAPDISSNINKFMLVILSITIFPIIVGIMMQTRIGNVFMLPFALVPMLLGLFTSKRTAFLTHALCIMICSIMLNYPYEFILLQIAAGHTAILCMRELSSRSQMFRCALFVFLAYSLIYFCYEMIVENDFSKMNFIMYAYFAISATLLLFSYPLMFIIEKVFGFVSNITLIEISNINNDLLRKLSQDAPGTFQHSMQVGNLAAEAAHRIGANSLMVRTGALYHDIGKMVNPIYFTENQSGGISPHDKLQPEESAKTIIKHVTDGMALARKHHLPQTIRNFIATHHGDSKTGYFYITYKNSHPGEQIDDSMFAYPGPKPSTREQAILMLADCVEAASHSIKEYTAENIESLVNKIVDAKVAEGELRLSPLTFRDIEEIKDSFKERLKAIYHTRISYPSENKQPKNGV